MTTDDKRKYIRHPLSYPLRTRILHHNTEHMVVQSESKNIGAGGLLFVSGEAIEDGAAVEINLAVEGNKFTLDGIVVRCAPAGDGQYDVAVSFTNPDEVLKVRMMEQVVRIEEFKQRLERRCNKKLEFSWVAKQWIQRYSKSFADHYNI